MSNQAMPEAVMSAAKPEPQRADAATEPQKTERFEMRVSADDLVMLDELRRHEADLPSRADMVRRLIQRASDSGPAAKRRRK